MAASAIHTSQVSNNTYQSHARSTTITELDQLLLSYWKCMHIIVDWFQLLESGKDVGAVFSL